MKCVAKCRNLGGFGWLGVTLAYRQCHHSIERRARVRSGEEILPKGSTARVGCTNVTDDRRQTDESAYLRQQRPERNVITFG